MRYKFRGKRLGDGEWVYGSLVEGAKSKSPFIVKPGEIYGVFVDRKTLGQFTGRYTRNNEPIFQGDVFESFYHPEVVFKHYVEWSDRLSSWYCRHEHDETDKAGSGSSQLWVFLNDKELHSELTHTIHDIEEVAE
jgi:hypothetical protein